MSPSGKAVDSGSTIPRVRILPPQPKLGADFKSSAPTAFAGNLLLLNIGVSPSGKASDSGSDIPRVRILPPQPSRGYKKDIARENLDFIEVFTVLWGKISVFDFIDVNRAFSLCRRS